MLVSNMEDTVLCPLAGGEYPPIHNSQCIPVQLCVTPRKSVARAEYRTVP